MGNIILPLIVAVYFIFTGIKIYITKLVPSGVGGRSGYVDIGIASYLLGTIFCFIGLYILYEILFKNKKDEKE